MGKQIKSKSKTKTKSSTHADIIEEENSDPSSPEGTDTPSYLLLSPDEEEGPKIRTLSLYGEVNEEATSELVYSLHILHKLGKEETLADPEDPMSEILVTYLPIELLVSTHGGSAPEMFAIHDMLRSIRKNCEVSTLGIGKVMSAGVLILASGTKGKRRIMKNCRVMLHSVIGASHGSLHSLENEMDEIRYLQDQHIKCLVAETDMTRSYLKKLMDKKVNVYLTAQEAVDLGIADEIV
tara:strand:- start:2915 stop:3628 length:714 start_codon:yes stop_codon:yes gene_type:complete